MIPRRTCTALLVSIAAVACAPGSPEVDEVAPASAAEEQDMSAQEGWIALFDGTSTDAWRGYNREDLPAGWRVVDGALTMVEPGGDIITTEQFESFELELEWMVREGGNSGIFYRAVETSDPIYYSAPEMQVLDDARHVDGGSRLTAAGANYGLHPAPEGVVRPAGEWNAVRILVNGNHVEHWLNGQKVVEYELGSDDWKQRVAASKFNEWPTYGKAERGHIGLQDHGDWVAYRNIRIRVLP
ncbi:MAG TPA: DUF1080 domain-containing protein [Longimicrobiales bacterium]